MRLSAASLPLALSIAALGPSLIGCSGASSDDTGDDTGSSESNIEYERWKGTCKLSATEQDIDTPARSLQAITVELTGTYGFDPALLRSDPVIAAAVPSEWKYIGGGPTLSRIFRASFTETPVAGAPPLGYTVKDKLLGFNPDLATIMPMPAGLVTRDFIEHPNAREAGTWALSPFRAIFTGQWSLEKVQATASRETWKFSPTLSPGRAYWGQGINLTQSETIALVKHLGSTKLTSSELPAAGVVGCSPKQVHLPPEIDNGLSFHIKFCCSDL